MTITLDFSKTPGEPGSPFRKVFQAVRGIQPEYYVFIQMFGMAWGYLICDRQKPIACKWSMDWQAPDALRECNAVLETL